MRIIASRPARLAPLLLAWSLAGCIRVVMPAAESGQASPTVLVVTATTDRHDATAIPLATYTPGSGGVVIEGDNGAAPTSTEPPTAHTPEGQPTSTIMPTRTPTHTPAATPTPTTVLTAWLQGEPAYQDGAWRLTFAWSGAGGVVIEIYRQGEDKPFRTEDPATSPYDELVLGEAGTYTWKVIGGNQSAEGTVTLAIPTAVPTQGPGPQPPQPTSPPQPTDPPAPTQVPPTDVPPTDVPPTDEPPPTEKPTEPPPPTAVPPTAVPPTPPKPKP